MGTQRGFCSSVAIQINEAIELDIYIRPWLYKREDNQSMIMSGNCRIGFSES